MQTQFVEKRAYPRYPISIPVSCFLPELNKTVDTCTCDISATGVGIIASDELSPGSWLNLCLQMPDNAEKISRKAKVVWSSMMSANSFRVGIRLEESSLKPIPLVLRAINHQRKY